MPRSGVKYELVPDQRQRRSGVTRIDYGAPADTRFEVFWKDFRNVPTADPGLTNSVGPVLSFFVLGHEAMRFDCLGEGGHYHIALTRPEAGGEVRLWFPEPTAPAQLDRSVFELKRNLAYYLWRNPVPALRHVTLRRDRHERHCDEARSVAIGLWQRHMDSTDAG